MAEIIIIGGGAAGLMAAGTAVKRGLKTVLVEKNDIELSEFAFILAIALVYFVKNKCDIVVLETGLGGRQDATNIIKNPLISGF